MARIWLLGMIAMGASGELRAQDAGNRTALQAAGVCARCHVNAVLEWEISGHARAGNSCSGCHGASKGHVADERNNVRPDRIPRGAAVASLCRSCHPSGCPSTRATEGCQTCHHIHALVDPRKPARSTLPEGDATIAQFLQSMQNGEQSLANRDWRSAAVAFRQAAQLRPDSTALQRLNFSLRKLSPELPGFRSATTATHPDLGLPLEVEVVGIGTKMRLVADGDVDLGDDSIAALRPAHTVAVAPFYVSPNPEHREATWPEAIASIERLNRSIPGGGFRLPTEPELILARRNFKTSFDIVEWSSSLFWPYPYDADDGRENLGAKGTRLQIVADRRQAGESHVHATYRLARSVPAPPPLKATAPPKKRTP